MKFNLSEYATVEERLRKFWEDHPNGAVITDIWSYDDDRIVFKASVFFERGGDLVATGFAEEHRSSSPVNRISMVENAETSAVGRALANCNYEMKKRASRQEMEKVERANSAPAESSVGSSVKPVGQGIAPAQVATLTRLIAESSMTTDEVAALATTTAGRQIQSLNELTKKEATSLMTALIRDKTTRMNNALDATKTKTGTKRETRDADK